MTIEKNNMKKILVVPDVPGWAFDHRAKDMMAMKSDKVQLSLKYLHQVKKEDIGKYDLIYPMATIMAYQLYKKGYPINKLGAGITSMRQFNMYQNKDKTLEKPFETFFKSLPAVNTASDEFVTYFSKYRPVIKTRVGIDHHIFKPLPNRPKNKVFTIGWVGTSVGSDLKGFRFVEEALDGLHVKIELRTKKDNFVHRNEMVAFYQGLNCFICSSNSEHLPLPVLEAAACGVPIVSTRVGIVPELVKHYESGIFVDRDPESIRNAIQYLMDHPEKCNQMANSIRSSILNDWTWEKCWKEWENYFYTAN